MNDKQSRSLTTKSLTLSHDAKLYVVQRTHVLKKVGSVLSNIDLTRDSSGRKSSVSQTFNGSVDVFLTATVDDNSGPLFGQLFYCTQSYPKKQQN